MSSRASPTSWGEGASLALVGNPSGYGVMANMPYGEINAGGSCVGVYSFSALPGLTCYLEDTGIGVFWLHCAA